MLFQSYLVTDWFFSVVTSQQFKTLIDKKTLREHLYFEPRSSEVYGLFLAFFEDPIANLANLAALAKLLQEIVPPLGQISKTQLQTALTTDCLGGNSAQVRKEICQWLQSDSPSLLPFLSSPPKIAGELRILFEHLDFIWLRLWSVLKGFDAFNPDMLLTDYNNNKDLREMYFHDLVSALTVRTKGGSFSKSQQKELGDMLQEGPSQYLKQAGNTPSPNLTNAIEKAINRFTPFLKEKLYSYLKLIDRLQYQFEQKHPFDQPSGPLGSGLQTIAQLMNAEVKIRMEYLIRHYLITTNTQEIKWDMVSDYIIFIHIPKAQVAFYQDFIDFIKSWKCLAKGYPDKPGYCTLHVELGRNEKRDFDKAISLFAGAQKKIQEAIEKKLPSEQAVAEQVANSKNPCSFRGSIPFVSTVKLPIEKIQKELSKNELSQTEQEVLSSFAL